MNIKDLFVFVNTALLTDELIEELQSNYPCCLSSDILAIPVDLVPEDEIDFLSPYLVQQCTYAQSHDRMALL